MSYLELSLRFCFVIASLGVMMLFANRGKSKTINPLFAIVPICTFMLCLLFTRTDLGLGIGFGLFAIFSILRFRTQTFSLPTIVFLFASITISILDCLFPSNEIAVLIVIQILLLIFFCGYQPALV